MRQRAGVSTVKGRLLWLAVTMALSLGTLPSAWALRYVLPEEDGRLIGTLVHGQTRYEDTLAALAQRYHLGYQKLRDANPEVDPWLPGEGTPIVLPFKHLLPEVSPEGIVINLPEYRMYYFLPDGSAVETWPIGIGREEFPTPIIDTLVVTRIENPSWTPTRVARREYLAEGIVLPPVVPPGPDNPLGPLAIQLGIPGYFIHGTNRPFGVGQRASQGCIRLYNEHIEELVKLAGVGTRVRTVDQPYKIGWHEGEAYLEVHRPLDADVDLARVRTLVMQATDASGRAVDWSQVDEIANLALGVPGRITLPAETATAVAALRAESAEPDEETPAAADSES